MNRASFRRDVADRAQALRVAAPHHEPLFAFREAHEHVASRVEQLSQRGARVGSGMKARDVGLAARQRAEALEAALERELADETFGPGPVVAERGEEEIVAGDDRQPAGRGARHAPRADIDLQGGLAQASHGSGVGRHELLARRREPRPAPPLQLNERDAERLAGVAEQAPRRAIREPNLLRRSTQRGARADRRE